MNSKSPEMQNRPYHLNIHIECSNSHIEVFNLLDGISEGYYGASLSKEDGGYSLDLFSFNTPDTDDMRGRIILKSNLLGLKDIKIKDISYDLSEDKNWLEEVFEAFPPREFGKFCVFGSHYKDEIHTDKISLQIDAALAFGSGEHATTQLCLEQLSLLCDQKPKNILDMGCGSGILAIGARKLWPEAQIFGVDNHADSVTSSIKHAKDNDCNDILFECGDGYKAMCVNENKPFDLIIANILTRPLIDMAPDAGRVCMEKGLIILSGLLTRQKDEVVDAYKNQGFFLQAEKTRDGWSCLLLEKQ